MNTKQKLGHTLLGSVMTIVRKLSNGNIESAI